MVSQYTEDERQARIFGKFQHLTGLVFKNWSREVHVIDPFDINEEDYVVVEALDPHPRNPDAVSWVAINKDGVKFVIDELYDMLETSQLGYMIKKKSESYRVVERIIDPSAYILDKHTNTSLAGELWNKSRLTYKPGSKQRQLAVRRTRSAFDYRMNKGMLITKPELFVFKTCTRTIFEIEHWQWSDWRGKSAEYKDPKEKPVDKDDHMLENIGRILLEEVSFEPINHDKPYVYSPLDDATPARNPTNDDPYA